MVGTHTAVQFALINYGLANCFCSGNGRVYLDFSCLITLIVLNDCYCVVCVCKQMIIIHDFSIVSRKCPPMTISVERSFEARLLIYLYIYICVCMCVYICIHDTSLPHNMSHQVPIKRPNQASFLTARNI